MNDYQEPSIAPTGHPIRIEDVLGTFPRVTSKPTWKPRTFKDAFAVYNDGTNHRIYWYDFKAAAWYYVTGTAA